MGIVFENTQGLPARQGPHKGDVLPYLNSAGTGLPLEVPDGHRLVEGLSSMGKPVPAPEGLETSKLAELQQAV